MNVGIVAAGGRSSRMGTGKKQFLLLRGVPLLAHTLLAFEQCPSIEKVIVVIESGARKEFEESILAGYGLNKVQEVVDGGEERQDSVLNGLQVLPAETARVAIHDGARPLVTPDLISQAIEALEGWDGVVTAVPVKDTVKDVDSQKKIAATIERENLWAAQTPQVFPPEILMKAHQRARMDGFYGTDDSILVERLGYRVRIIMGSYENIKVTTPEDLAIAESILRWREEGKTSVKDRPGL